MNKNRYDNRLILDAGFVSIQPNKILGLHGKKLFYVIFIVFILFFISSINLICLLWIIYKIDWLPFYQNGSKIFSYNQASENIQIYKQSQFHDIIATTKIDNFLSNLNITSKTQIDISGNHSWILIDNNQIALNTEYFYMKNYSSIDFNNFQLYRYNQKTKLHLNHIYTRSISNQSLKIFTDNYSMISKSNKVLFSSQNITINGNKKNYQSVIRLNNYQQQKMIYFDHRQKPSYGNLEFESNSIYLDIRRMPLVENTQSNTLTIYRLCVCNTTFLLLRSFAHQSCPLC